MSHPRSSATAPFSLLRDGRSVYVASLSSIKDSICHPPCDCNDCQNGFYAAQEQYQSALTYRRRLSDHDAKGIADLYVKQIYVARERLTERLSSHADVFMNRWRKRSQDKRQALCVRP